MNAAPLSAGYEFLRSAREGPKGSNGPTPPRRRRIETQVWIWLVLVPCCFLLLQTLAGFLTGDAGPFSTGFVVATIVSPILILWALIGGARVERMTPRWASFHAGLSAGTAAVSLLALRHFEIVFDWLSESVVDALKGDRPVPIGLGAALVRLWFVLWVLALPAFAALDTFRGVGAVRGTGLGKLAIELGVIGAALATITWWIPWP